MLGLSAEEFGFVLVSFAFALTTFLGGRAGKNAVTKQAPQAQNAGGMMEVAGALVSDKAAREWVKSNDALSDHVKALTKAIEKNTDACKDAAENAHEASEAIRQLSIELVRNQHSRRPT